MKTIYKLLVIGALMAIIINGIALQKGKAYLDSDQDALSKQKILIKKLSADNSKLRELIAINEVLSKYYSHKSIKVRRKLAELIFLAAKENNLSSELILAVILTESSFRDDVVSNKGAVGLMQLLPSTANALSRELRIKWRGDHVLYDSKQNVRLGAYYLRKMMEVFDDMSTALTAYNAGPTRVIRYARRGTPYPPIYADKVNANYKMIKDKFFQD